MDDLAILRSQRANFALSIQKRPSMDMFAETRGILSKRFTMRKVQWLPLISDHNHLRIFPDQLCNDHTLDNQLMLLQNHNNQSV